MREAVHLGAAAPARRQRRLLGPPLRLQVAGRFLLPVSFGRLPLWLPAAYLLLPNAISGITPRGIHIVTHGKQ